MTTKNSPAIRRSVESLHNIFGNLKVLTQGRETPLRSAFYNFVIVGVIASIVVVGIVLGPFLKPLLWALLFGAVLFPFKRKISCWLKSWFDELETTNTSLIYGTALVPFKAFQRIGESGGLWIKENKKFIAGAIFSLIFIRILIAFQTHGIICFILKLIYLSHEIFTSLLNIINWIVLLTVFIIYFVTVVLFWKPKNELTFTIIGQSLWICGLAYISSFFGALQVPVFLLSLIYALMGLGYDLKTRTTEHENSSLAFQFSQIIDVKTFYNKSAKTDTVQSETSENPINDSLLSFSNNLQNDNKVDNSDDFDSDTYFVILFYACAATIAFKNSWILFILMIPVCYYFLQNCSSAVGFSDYVSANVKKTIKIIKGWIIERHSALLPVSLPGNLQLNEKLNIYIRSYLKSSIDMVSSIIVIVFLILIVLFAGIFFCVQIYSETFAVVQLGSDLVNRTLTVRPDLVQMLPEGFQGSMDDMLDNAHHYGRQYIATYVDKIFRETEPEQGKKLKHQILLVWDRLIQNWLDRSDTVGPKIPSSAITNSLDEIVDNAELLSAAKQGITDWVKSNIGMLMNVLDSLWIIVRNNMSLFGSILGTIFSMILGGGHAVISFIVNTIIFFTGLFYLLSSSDEKYAALNAIDALGFSLGSKIAASLEDSISGVILATLKLALFHGLFTWITHTWFGAHVVFLPAAIAAIFAAAPFLGTYWCSVPAFLDLWLSQDRFYMGVLLFLIHFLIPSSFVDPAIIAEIKGGGHPYLTGLSIAGGMFWLGIEGAILGPLFLCLLVVIIDLTTASLKESASFTTAKTPLIEQS